MDPDAAGCRPPLAGSSTTPACGTDPGGKHGVNRAKENRLSARFIILTGLSLLASLAIALLWLRGLHVVDEIYVNVGSRLCIAGSFPNHVNFVIYRQADYHGPLIQAHFANKRVSPMPIFWEIRFRGDSLLREFSLPWWPLLIFTLSMPAWMVSAAMRRRRRFARGCCPECGYDLRASKDRCPECGKSFQQNN